MNERTENLKEMFCFSKKKNRHILKDPRILPCGTKLCYECIKDSNNCNSSMIKCDYRHCKQRHFIDDVNYVKIDKKTIAAIEYNLQNLIQNQLEIFKYNLDNVTEESQCFEQKLEDKIFRIYSEIDIKFDSIYRELDNLTTKMRKDVERRYENIKMIQRLNRGEINENVIRVLEENSEKSKSISQVKKLHNIERLMKKIYTLKTEPFIEQLIKIDGNKNLLTSHIGFFEGNIEENK